jgi:hypothetical protein
MAPVHGFYAKSTLISLVIDSESGLRDSASGFFYEFEGDRFVVTNKHVLEFPESEVYSEGEGDSLMNPDEVSIYIRDDPNDLTNVSRVQLELFGSDEEALWVEHPNQDVDLVAIPLDIDFSTIHNRSYSSNDFVDDEIEILGGDSAIAIGYPKGLYDAQTYFPVARDGLIPTPPNGTYKGLPRFPNGCKNARRNKR